MSDMQETIDLYLHCAEKVLADGKIELAEELKAHADELLKNLNRKGE